MDIKDTLLKTLCLIRNLQYCHCNQHCKFNSHVGQGRIIMLLKQKGNLRTLEIAKLLNINISTANEFVHKLVKQGYVKRLPDNQDKRIKKVSLTKLGKDTKIDTPLLDHLFDNLNKKQLSNLKYYLNIINKNIEKLM